MFAVGEFDEFGLPFIPPRFLREPDFALFYVGGRQAARETVGHRSRRSEAFARSRTGVSAAALGADPGRPPSNETGRHPRLVLTNSRAPRFISMRENRHYERFGFRDRRSHYGPMGQRVRMFPDGLARQPGDSMWCGGVATEWLTFPCRPCPCPCCLRCRCGTT